MGGDKGRGDDDEKKRGWLIEEWGGATIKEKADTCLPIADELVIVAFNIVLNYFGRNDF